jgi:hypothetical protein
MDEQTYHDHVIKVTVSQDPDIKLWNARGQIEFFEGGTLRTIQLTGPINRFTSDAEAKSDFIQQAKRWIDERRT